MKSLLKLKPYLKPYWFLIVLSAVFAILLAGVRSIPVLLVKQLTDDVLPHPTPEKIVRFPLMVIGIFIVNFIVRFVHSYTLRVVVARVNQKVKNELYDHVMSLSADHFTTKSTGGLVSRIGQDPNFIDHVVSQLTVVFREPFHILFILGWCLYTNWKLTLFVLAIFPFLAVVFGYSGKALKRYIHRMQEENARLFATIQESLSGIRIIKSFRLEGYMRGKFRERSDAYTKNLLKTALMEETSHPMVELLSAVAVALIIYFGGLQVLHGELTAGQLTAFFVAFGLMQNPIRVLNDVNIKVNTGTAAIERVWELFDLRTNLYESPNPKPLPDFTREIEFQGVRFAYPDAPEREVLRGISFRVPKATTVALVGPSGAGKSSVVSLLPRIFDLTAGKILIDGIELRDYKLEDLRHQVSVVSQDVFLFNDTIFENIRCGRLEATDDEVYEAARLAFADDFIQRLPEKYATVIGDRGQKLSGGERQRLSIARAFLRHSPILILDEATSALDNASEKAVQAALERLMRNRTVIVIAHRLSTIRHATEILVMREGEIAERGTHEQLMARGGDYSMLVRMSHSGTDAGVEPAAGEAKGAKA